MKYMISDVDDIIDEYMTDEEIIDQAIKYNSEADFKKNSPEQYRVARRRGTEYLDEVCRHMQRLPKRPKIKNPLAEAVKNFTTEEMAREYHHKKNQKVIPQRKKVDLFEFFEQVDVEYIEQGKHHPKIQEYIHKNNKQVKQINKAHENFIAVMGDKMCSQELTYVRFKTIVDTAIKAMSEKNTQNLEILKTLVVMDESNFSDDTIYEKNFKLLDDNFLANEKNVTVIFDIALKLSQMKNKDSTVEHSYALDDLDHLKNNIDSYIK